MPYVLDKEYEDECARDDNKQALLKTRQRIARGFNKSYGVVMVSTAAEMVHSAHTIPIWKAYCEKHGYDFFLQEESLAPEFRDGWTKPRLLLELLSKATWRYIFMVDSNSLPVQFDQGWQYAVKEHMRKHRYKNDQPNARYVWCPEDCEDEYTTELHTGLCYGPHLSGCIFWVKPKTLPKVKTWYEKRKERQYQDFRGLKQALKNTREKGDNYDEMMWSDVKEEMGKSDSTFLVTHSDDDNLNVKLRDRIIKTISKHKVLGEILNKRGEHKPEL
jgi:hypothetical protein